MAVAAETDNNISRIINYERPPEVETYGRSLSTIYRLGAFMVKQTAAEAIRSPEADQVRVEFYTSVEEGFGTDLELGGGLEVRDFDTRPVIDGRVMAKDLKTPVSDMTHAGLICAEETAETDKHFLPQLVRSGWDHKNALVVDEMARGETSYNTRIVVSPFPEEAALKTGNDYWRNIGYVPHLKRGFVQLYHASEEGLISGSLSFDGSNKEKLTEIFAHYGIEIPQDEVTDNWLQYAITNNLYQDEAKELALEIADLLTDPEYKKTTNTVEVTSEHRAVMDKVFNESYAHTCESLARRHQTPDTRKLILQLADKAEYFNEHYKKALYKMRDDGSKFNDDDMAVLHDLLVYSTIEMMRALHIKKVDAAESTLTVNQRVRYFDDAYIQAIDAQAFQSMLGGFGADGAVNNRTYSACGLAISLGGSQEYINKQEAFGGVDSKKPEKKQEWFGKYKKQGTCVNCYEEDTEVGEQNWCEACIKSHCGTK